MNNIHKLLSKCSLSNMAAIYITARAGVVNTMVSWKDTAPQEQRDAFRKFLLTDYATNIQACKAEIECQGRIRSIKTPAVTLVTDDNKLLAYVFDIDCHNSDPAKIKLAKEELDFVEKSLQSQNLHYLSLTSSSPDNNGFHVWVIPSEATEMFETGYVPKMKELFGHRHGEAGYAPEVFPMKQTRSYKPLNLPGQKKAPNEYSVNLHSIGYDMMQKGNAEARLTTEQFDEFIGKCYQSNTNFKEKMINAFGPAPVVTKSKSTKRIPVSTKNIGDEDKGGFFDGAGATRNDPQSEYVDFDTLSSLLTILYKICPDIERKIKEDCDITSFEIKQDFNSSLLGKRLARHANPLAKKVAEFLYGIKAFSDHEKEINGFLTVTYNSKVKKLHPYKITFTRNYNEARSIVCYLNLGSIKDLKTLYSFNLHHPRGMVLYDHIQTIEKFDGDRKGTSAEKCVTLNYITDLDMSYTKITGIWRNIDIQSEATDILLSFRGAQHECWNRKDILSIEHENAKTIVNNFIFPMWGKTPMDVVEDNMLKIIEKNPIIDEQKFIETELLKIINIKYDGEPNPSFYAGMINEYFRRVAYRLTTHLRSNSTLLARLSPEIRRTIVCHYVMFLHGHQGSGKTTLAKATSEAINRFLGIQLESPVNLGEFYSKVPPLYLKSTVPEEETGDVVANFHYSPTVLIDDVRSLTSASQTKLCTALTARDFELRYPHMKGIPHSKISTTCAYFITSNNASILNNYDGNKRRVISIAIDAPKEKFASTTAFMNTMTDIVYKILASHLTRLFNATKDEQAELTSALPLDSNIIKNIKDTVQKESVYTVVTELKSLVSEHPDMKKCPVITARSASNWNQNGRMSMVADRYLNKPYCVIDCISADELFNEFCHWRGNKGAKLDPTSRTELENFLATLNKESCRRVGGKVTRTYRIVFELPESMEDIQDNERKELISEIPL